MRKHALFPGNEEGTQRGVRVSRGRTLEVARFGLCCEFNMTTLGSFSWSRLVSSCSRQDLHFEAKYSTGIADSALSWFAWTEMARESGKEFLVAMNCNELKPFLDFSVDVDEVRAGDAHDVVAWQTTVDGVYLFLSQRFSSTLTQQLSCTNCQSVSPSGAQ